MPTRTESLVAAVDVGGTFTDIAVWDGVRGTLRTTKLLTTPDDPSIAVVEGLASIGLDVASVVHGTTLVTNALIERRGAVVGLITTHGFRDVLEVGTELRYDTFDLKLRRAEPLVPRRLRAAVAERIATDGEVVVPLDIEALTEVVRDLVGRGVEAIAIGFFNAYANPTHERAAAQVCQALTELPVSTSTEVSGEAREYERFSTTVANAYVQPLVGRYLGALSGKLGRRLFLMLSDGTVSTVEAARQRPITMVESGPAAGSIAAAHLASECDWPAVLAFDMGGTTAKISLIHAARAELTRDVEVARVHRFKKGSGLPLRVPSVDLLEIGAGGGSIARVDALGLLKVGPDSAGAAPGPACYGRGGQEPTVTDADLVLGYISARGLAGGRVALDTDAAEAAIAQLSACLGTNLEDAAAGIADVVDTHMATAARMHLAEHGRDPRRYTLVAFGGAAPLHAFRVAHLLGIREVAFPRDAGLASATGMLVAPRGAERVRSWRCPTRSLDWNVLDSVLHDLEQSAREVIAQAGVEHEQMRVEVAADLRYIGQGHELTVAIDPSAIRARDAGAIEAAFGAEYRRRYNLVLEQVPVEVVSWRVRAHGPSLARQLERAASSSEARGSVVGRRRAFFRECGGFVDVPVYHRAHLRDGDLVSGPALVEEETTTSVIGPGWSARLDQIGNLVMRCAA
jgi:N-methylhydantoinase A/oxoprolinase/acetone carboxylase beta subunit